MPFTDHTEYPRGRVSVELDVDRDLTATIGAKAKISHILLSRAIGGSFATVEARQQDDATVIFKVTVLGNTNFELRRGFQLTDGLIFKAIAAGHFATVFYFES